MQADTAIDPLSPPAPAARSSTAPLSRWAIANMCCGLFGVQIVWGLQNVDTSRIFQTLGANLDELPILWIAAPITGLLVQPIIGHLSDRTWGPLGRRRPYLLAGAIVSAIALVAMPNVRSLWAACVMLWLLTGAINVAMEPFRALVADSVPEEQRSAAFAMQVGFIGAGAVVASILPWLLAHGFGLASVAPPGVLPPSLRAAFAIGAIGLIVSVGITVVTTPERPPGQLAGHSQPVARPDWASTSSSSLIRHGAIWIAGHRRFVLFPPDQVANLYIGPLENPPPLSLVDPEAPDVTRFPRFREALAAARVAHLAPGDALLMPRYWWHHVTSRDRYNAMVNYWWGGGAAGLGDPHDAFLTALLAIKPLPEGERAYWQAMFTAHVFGDDGAAHLPPRLRGVLGAMTPGERVSLKQRLKSAALKS